jgi:hypothetical protein
MTETYCLVLMCETLINILALAVICYTLHPNETTTAVFWIPEQVVRLHEQFSNLWIHLIVILPWIALPSEPKNKTAQLPELYIQTREQLLKSVIRDSPVAYKDMLESRPADPDPDPSILTSWVALKPEHQPTDMIVLQLEIREGIEFQEKIMVRMHKTTPFVQLKDKLRKKNDNESELVADDPRGCYPVFDHETPLSVSFVRYSSIIVIEKFKC